MPDADAKARAERDEKAVGLIDSVVEALEDVVDADFPGCASILREALRLLASGEGGE